jgi:hypothetical protein
MMDDSLGRKSHLLAPGDHFPSKSWFFGKESGQQRCISLDRLLPQRCHFHLVFLAVSPLQKEFELCLEKPVM